MAFEPAIFFLYIREYALWWHYFSKIYLCVIVILQVPLVWHKYTYTFLFKIKALKIKNTNRKFKITQLRARAMFRHLNSLNLLKNMGDWVVNSVINAVFCKHVTLKYVSLFLLSDFDTSYGVFTNGRNLRITLIIYLPFIIGFQLLWLGGSA